MEVLPSLYRRDSRAAPTPTPPQSVASGEDHVMAVRGGPRPGTTTPKSSCYGVCGAVKACRLPQTCPYNATAQLDARAASEAGHDASHTESSARSSPEFRGHAYSAAGSPRSAEGHGYGGSSATARQAHTHGR